MFAKSVIDCDLFIDMPQSARLLYYDLSMRADDDGFITPQKIIRMTGASKDDLSILIAKKFVIPFDSGVVVIRHWKVHNYIRKDTYAETEYREEKNTLHLNERNVYEENPVDGMSTSRGRAVDTGKDRLGKDSLGYTQKENYIKEKVDDVEGKEVTTSKRFVKPTLSEAQAYADEKGYAFSVEQWISYYESNGWKVGKNPMKSWKASMNYWNTNNGNNGRVQGRKEEEVDHGYNPLVDRIDNDEEGNPWQ